MIFECFGVNTSPVQCILDDIDRIDRREFGNGAPRLVLAARPDQMEPADHHMDLVDPRHSLRADAPN